MAAQLALAMNLALEEREETYERSRSPTDLVTGGTVRNRIYLNSSPPAVPHIVNIAFPAYWVKHWPRHCPLRGLWLQRPQLCGASSPVSHVLSAMGQDKAEAQSAIRISLAENHTEAEVCTSAAVRKNVALLRSIGGKK